MNCCNEHMAESNAWDRKRARAAKFISIRAQILVSIAKFDTQN